MILHLSPSRPQVLRTLVGILLLVLSLWGLWIQPFPAWAISTSGKLEHPADPFKAKGNLENEVLYYIAVDRFADGDLANNIPDFAFPIDAEIDPTQRAYHQANRSIIQYSYDPSHRYVNMYWGGDLAGIIEKLDYLQDLGVTQLVLSPIQDHANALLYTPGKAGYLHSQANSEAEVFDPFYAGLETSFYGSWMKDWFELEEHFQDPEDVATDHLQIFRRLLDEAGQRGIGVILELSLNGTSPYRMSPSYGEFDLDHAEQWLVDNGAIYRQGEEVASYVDPTTFDLSSQGWFHPPLSINYRHPTPTMIEEGIVAGLPDLDQAVPEVRDYFLDAIRFWLTLNPAGYQVAGFWLDGIPNINLQFWQELEAAALDVDPDVILIGSHLGAGYSNRQAVQWYANTQSYSWIDYGYSSSARHYFGRDRNWDGRTYLLREQALGHRGQYYNYSSVEKVLHWILNPSQSLEIPRHSLDLIVDRDALGWVRFIELNDQPRLFSSYPKMTRQAYTSLIKFMFTSPGVPMLMYGVETGLSVPYHIDHQGLYGTGGYPFNLPMMIWPGDQGWDQDVFELTRTAAHLRQHFPVLRYGTTEFLFPSGSRKDSDLFMLRTWPNHEANLSIDQQEKGQVLYAYSTFGGEFELTFDQQEFSQQTVDQVIEAESEQILSTNGEPISLKLDPEESRILILK